MSDFVDRVTVHVKGGDGGNGSAGIRREKQAVGGTERWQRR